MRYTANVHVAYKESFALLKDADPDIPILIEARKEYARLRLPDNRVYITEESANVL